MNWQRWPPGLKLAAVLALVSLFAWTSLPLVGRTKAAAMIIALLWVGIVWVAAALAVRRGRYRVLSSRVFWHAVLVPAIALFSAANLTFGLWVAVALFGLSLVELLTP